MTEATDLKDNLDMSAADIRDQASEELCKSLLESLLLQIKQLKKPWEEMTKAEQDTVIEALRKNVLTATKCAVRLIAGNGAITVAGALESIQIKDTIKAVVTVRKNAENLPELYDAAGQEVLVVCSGNAVYDKNVDMVQGEDDQRGFEFGAEYDEDRTLDDEREAGIVDVEPRRIEGPRK